ncbi:hypothetical protein PENTCL1PPCAC_30204, partial [Pristionchus entomophagus]
EMPNHNVGECVATETGFVSDQWVNFDCSTSSLPFMCARDQASIPARHQASGCPLIKEFASGDDVHSLSFPHPPEAGSCDYLLIGRVDTRDITLSISTFDVNKCCDLLHLRPRWQQHRTDHRLSGSFASGTQITINSYSVRHHWNSTSGANVRGWQINMEAH